MNRFLRNLAASAVAVIGLASATNAATFDFAEPFPLSYDPSVSYSLDGTNFTVSAFTRNGTGTFSSNVVRGPGGLGVGGILFDPNPFVDGGNGYYGLDDFLVFDFKRDTYLTRVLFSALLGNYDIRVDQGSGLTQLVNEGTGNPFEFGGLLVNRLVIGADNFGDSFGVRELQAAAVPLPAGTVLLLTALGGLALQRRRYKA